MSSQGSFKIQHIREHPHRDAPRLGTIAAIGADGSMLCKVNSTYVGEGSATFGVTKRSVECTEEALQAAFSTTVAMTLPYIDGLALVGPGTEYRLEQQLARNAGFVEQTVNHMMRGRLWGYPPAPSGSLIVDPLLPIFCATQFLTYVRLNLVNTESLRDPLLISILEQFSASGIPPQDRPPTSRRAN